MDSGSSRGDATAPPFCSQCGSRLGPHVRFCPQCGTQVVGERDSQQSAHDDHGARSRESVRGSESTRGSDSMRGADSTDGWRDRADASRSDTSTERTPPRRERPPGFDSLRDRVESRLVDGWEIEHDYGDRVIMVDRSYGDTGMHVLIALCTVWWTSGLGNAAYAAYKYYVDAERLIIRSRETQNGTIVTEDVQQSNDGGSLVTVAGFIVGVMLLVTLVPLLLVFFALSSEIAAAMFVVALLLGAAFAVSKASASDHEFTAFGRAKDVSERVVTDPDRPCTACLDPVDTGVERTYRDQYLFAGFPVKTYEVGTNHYCRSCADGNADMSVEDELDEASVRDEREAESVGQEESRSAAENESTAATEDESPTVVEDDDRAADSTTAESADSEFTSDEATAGDDDVDDAETEVSEKTPEDAVFEVDSDGESS
ncbi:zinc-ribbon domain-containing protein [Haloarchaeobius sp. DFWS5]|uniref:zinc ribbon domain-containing protein n=1 Tax=Haloarchaeobius sp. DFWS5 TaxID=3446114 RepID=UPI003EB7098B